MVNGSTVSNEGLSVQYNQAKTYTTQTAVSRWHSNEASGSQFKLNLFAIGNATSSSRVFKFQTSNEGVANDGIIAFQTDGGNLGIGTSSPQAKLEVGGSIMSSGSDAAAAANKGVLDFNTGNTRLISFGPNSSTNGGFQFLTLTSSGTGSTAVTITSGGELCVGVTGVSTTSNGTVITQGSSYANLRLFGTGSQTFAQFFLGGTAIGSITGSGSVTSYNVTSDYRLKQDLKDYNALELVSAINTYDYEWKSDNTRAYGVLAHELQEVLPYAVHGEKDAEEMQGVDYSKIVPILVKAIQEQQKQIEELKLKIK
jgi:hypothetical protein